MMLGNKKTLAYRCPLLLAHGEQIGSVIRDVEMGEWEIDDRTPMPRWLRPLLDQRFATADDLLAAVAEIMPAPEAA